MSKENSWGEKILGEYIASVPIGQGLESIDRWQLLELRAHDFDRRYGREFELKRTNDSGTQGWVAGRFSREELTGLRDMLTEVLEK